MPTETVEVSVGGGRWFAQTSRHHHRFALRDLEEIRARPDA
jgi:hypothetical protein